MTRIVRAGLALMVGSAMGMISGCGSAGGGVPPEAGKEIAQENTLNEVGMLVRAREADAHKPAAKSTDFARYEMGFPDGYRRVTGGEVVFLFGAPIDESASSKVLAYEKQAPDSGGYVLMQDGKTIKKMTADEFKSAEKAPGKAEAATKK